MGVQGEPVPTTTMTSGRFLSLSFMHCSSNNINNLQYCNGMYRTTIYIYMLTCPCIPPPAAPSLYRRRRRRRSHLIARSLVFSSRTFCAQSAFASVLPRPPLDRASNSDPVWWTSPRREMPLSSCGRKVLFCFASPAVRQLLYIGRRTANRTSVQLFEL